MIAILAKLRANKQVLQGLKAHRFFIFVHMSTYTPGNINWLSKTHDFPWIGWHFSTNAERTEKVSTGTCGRLGLSCDLFAKQKQNSEMFFVEKCRVLYVINEGTT